MKYSSDLFKQALKLNKKYGPRSATRIAKELKVPVRTVQHWILNHGGLPPASGPTATFKRYTPEPTETLAEEEVLKDTVRVLRSELKKQHKQDLTEQYVKQHILKLAETPIDAIPQWLVKPSVTAGTSLSPGVPTLFASDWHWGEVVHAGQLGGANEYNVTIAHERARLLIRDTVELLNKHLSNHKYPGIVFALGGDMVSGDIHEELTATNELDIMPTVVDIIGVLIWCIETLADTFNNVFVPCVSGNHGRNTHKIRMKGRNFTSFDWLIYQMLAKHFENDHRIQFLIPDGSDALYSVYNQRYLLTHGDQFRGGDGMIGALGPIIRGDHKKRTRNSQIDRGYDTMICGHWHQLIQLQRLIVNGSLKGYDEYAYQSNFPFEPPRQALWVTHEKWGITFSCPVQVSEPMATAHKDKKKWIQWKN